MPRSVQQSIPIDRIYADGVWQSENVFSLMWQISDINYAMQSDAAKQNILTQLGTVYAGIPADCWMQVCIVSQRMDEKAFARDVLYHRENDGFDALRVTAKSRPTPAKMEMWCSISTSSCPRTNPA